MIKKVVWLPYDFDTALGINNEGALVFDYDLEDIDHIEGGADVFNGQQSVLWKNIRAAFADELKSMYQTLRSQSTSTTGLSYEAVEKMFEEHQSKWPEAIFNEDAWFKYIDPLVNPSPGKEPTAAYLSMLQGSKTEQRKWWLYNRFKYIDSKYNAGSALTDYIQVRGYAKDNITITPYATIYPTVKFGSYLVQARGTRGVATTLICPLDNVNDTEIYIYSASQLASVGDLSGLKVGFADFSMATKLQNIKLGDSSSSYSNANLKELYLGNNVLLKTIDVRNCTALGSGDQKTVNISGCANIENVYFDNTQITGITLPNGGILKVLHLPNTITNLTIMNQSSITDLVANVSNVTTLRIENCPTVDTETMLTVIPANSRVRLVGFTWEAANSTEIESRLDLLDTMRGLDINGNNLETAYVEGIIHTEALTGEQIASYNSRYPYLTVTADYVTSYLTYKSYDGETTLKTVACYNGVPQESAPTVPTRTDSSDGHYSYTGTGWSTEMNSQVADPNATVNVMADRTVYATYTWTVKKYTVTWKNAGNTTLETDTNVAWGTVPHYDGTTPTYDGQTSTGWLPDPTQPITGDTTFTAQYLPVYTVTFKNETGTTTLDTQRVVQGGTATYGGTTPVNTEDASLAFLGWATTTGAHTANAVLTNIQASVTVFAAFESAIDVSEITDTWDQIIASIDAGTYATKYKLGQYKPLDLGTEGTINMQIVGMNVDELADGSGYAPLTFIGMELSDTTYAMNPTLSAAGGWEASDMRSYLATTVLSHFPASMRGRIVPVKKYSMVVVDEAVATDGCITYDALWLPSAREVAVIETGSSKKETQGPTYAPVYGDRYSCIKYCASDTNHITKEWFLRSTLSTTKFSIIATSGVRTSGKASSSKPFCLGFCLGLERESITDDWATILANTNYATDYSIGDTKMLDLGTEGKHLMEIVAFDEDDKADGTGKAGITWISKTLLNTNCKMNASSSVTGGWETSQLRSYLKETIKPLIPEIVRTGIVDVSKVQNVYEGNVKSVLSSTEDVWVPNAYELTNNSYYENTGAVYSSKFIAPENRVKKKIGSSSGSTWWLRTMSSKTIFSYVLSSGSLGSSYSPSSSFGIALGFCTN